MTRINDSYLVDLKHSGDFESDNIGGFTLIAGTENLRQAMFHRLITVKGAIVHRPEYGVGLRSYQNGISSLAKKRELAILIQQELEKDARIESIDSVKFIEDEGFNPGTFLVEVKGTAVGLGLIEETFDPFDRE